MNNDQHAWEELPYVSYKVVSNKNMFLSSHPCCIQQKQAAGWTPNEPNLSLVSSLIFKALHKIKKALNGTYLCQILVNNLLMFFLHLTKFHA